MLGQHGVRRADSLNPPLWNMADPILFIPFVLSEPLGFDVVGPRPFRWKPSSALPLERRRGIAQVRLEVSTTEPGPQHSGRDNQNNQNEAPDALPRASLSGWQLSLEAFDMLLGVS